MRLKLKWSTWCFDIETLCSLLAICEGNPLVTNLQNICIYCYSCHYNMVQYNIILNTQVTKLTTDSHTFPSLVSYRVSDVFGNILWKIECIITILMFISCLHQWQVGFLVTDSMTHVHAMGTSKIFWCDMRGFFHENTCLILGAASWY